MAKHPRIRGESHKRTDCFPKLNQFARMTALKSLSRVKDNDIVDTTPFT